MDARLRKSKISHFLGPVGWILLQSDRKLIIPRCISGTLKSRVLGPPGGKQSFTLGGYTDEELERMRMKREAKTNPATVNANMGTENQKKVTTNEKLPSEPTKQKAAPSITKATIPQKAVAYSTLPGRRNGRTSSNAFASSSTTNSFNVVTDRPTSRVSEPPGGKSSFRLGYWRYSRYIDMCHLIRAS